MIDRPTTSGWHFAIFESLDCIISLCYLHLRFLHLFYQFHLTTYHPSTSHHPHILNLHLKPARHRLSPHPILLRNTALCLLVGMPSPYVSELWNIPFVLAPKIGSCRGRRPTPSEVWARTNVTL